MDVILGVTAGPSDVRAWFEFILPLTMAAGVAVSRAVVSVSEWVAWAAWAAPAQAGKSGHPELSVRTGGVNAGMSG